MNINPLKSIDFTQVLGEKKLELRMYGLVCYQLIGIQKGIQYGHTNDQYAAHMIEFIMNWTIDLNVRKQHYKYAEKSEESLYTYLDWLVNWKTYIILNGGTTNTNPERLGTLNKHLQTLRDNGVFCTEFYEPDLGDQLTSVNFLVDERVFLRDKYPDFQFQLKQTDILNPNFICDDEKNDWETWVESIGGKKNLFLRSFLSNFKLA